MKKLLFLFFFSFLSIISHAQCGEQGLIVNEFSNGSGTAEYIELVVVGCPGATVDISGWIIDDNNGDFSGGPSSTEGIAAGHIRFKEIAFWENVNVGSIIVIYNESDKNTAVPADDPTDSNNDDIYIIPADHTNLEGCTGQPTTGNANYSCSYGVGQWSTVSFRNGGDAAQTRKSDASFFHGLSYGSGGDGFDGGPDGIDFPGSGSGHVYFLDNTLDDNYRDVNNFTQGDVPNDETPGAANNTANQNWITYLKTTQVVDINLRESSASCSDKILTVDNFCEYLWSTNETTQSITVSTSGNYSVTVTDENGCQFTDNINVTITPTSLDVSLALNPNPICQDETVTATVSGSDASGATFTWSTNGNITNDAGNTEDYEFSGTGTRTVSVTVNKAGCTQILSEDVTIHPLPTGSIAQNPDPVCEGDDVDLNVSLSAGATFTWNDNASNTNPRTINDPVHGANYAITITDGNSCTGNADISLNVTALPNAPANNTFKFCKDATSTQLTPNGASYTWYDGSMNPLPNAPTPSTATVGSTTYFVTQTVSNCESAAGRITVTIDDLPTGSIAQNPNPVCEGTNVDLEVNVIAGATFTWDDIASSVNPRTISNPINGTVYSIAITDGNGCEGAANLTLDVTPLPAAPADNTFEFCKDATPSQLTPNGAQYNWYDASMNPIAGAPTPNTSVVGTSTYYVSETASACEGPTGEITVEIKALPTGSIAQNPNPVCEGADVALQVTANAGTTFAWDDNGSSTNARTVVAPNNGDTYSITLVGANSCEADASITIDVTPTPAKPADRTEDYCLNDPSSKLTPNGVDFEWFDASMNPLADAPTPNTSTAGTTVYYVREKDGLCTGAVGEITVNVNAVEGIAIAADKNPICIGEDVTLSVSFASGSSFVWDDNGSSTNPRTIINPADGDRYSVTLSDANLCSSTDEIVIEVRNLPVVAVAADNNPICEGENVVLTASGANSYEWEDNSTSNPRTVTPNTTTTYSVVGTDNIGCESAAANITVTVKPLPAAPSDNSFVYCKGETSTQLTPNAAQFNWYDASMNSLAMAPTPNTNIVATTTYFVSETTNGCEGDVGEITVIVNDLPVVNATADKSAICDGDDVTLTASGAQQYIWQDDNSTNAIRTENPTTTTTYTVQGTDANNCTNSASVSVIVNSLPNVTVGANPTEICEGETSELQAQGAINYVWLDDNSTANPRTVSPGSTTNFTVEGTNGNGCKNTASVLVTVYPIPAKPAAQNFEFCEDVPANQLTPNSPDYIWFDDNLVELPEAPTPNTDNQTTFDYFYAQELNGCRSALAEVFVEIKDKPTAFLPQNNAVCQFSTPEQLQPSTSEFEWYNASNNFIGTAPTPSTNTVGTTIYYFKRVINGCESDATQYDFVVKDKPAPPADNNYTYCYQETATQLTPNTSEFTWLDENKNPLPNAPTPNTNVDGFDTYYVFESLNNCHSDSAIISVTVYGELTPYDDVVLEFCQFQSASPINPGSGFPRWYDQDMNDLGNTNPTPNTNIAGTTQYFVAREANGCFSDVASIQVVVYPQPAVPSVPNAVEYYCQNASSVAPLVPNGAQYNWYDAQNNFLGNAVTPQVTNVDTTSYFVREEANNCEGNAAEVVVIVRQKPSAPSVSNFGPYCQFETATALQPNGNGYEWFELNGSGSFVSRGDAVTPNTNIAGNTTYSVTETVEGCTSDPTSVVVEVKAKPSDPTFNNAVYCVGEAASPLVASANSGNTLVWYDDVQNSLGNTAPTPSTANSGSTNYYVSQVQNGCESDLAGPLTVLVHEIPTMSYTVSSACPGQPFNIDFNFTGTANFDVTITDNTSSSVTNASFSSANPADYSWQNEGDFTIKLENDANCAADNISQFPQNFTRNSVPEASLDVHTNACAQETYVVATITGVSDFNFVWRLPSGSMVNRNAVTNNVDSVLVTTAGNVHLLNLSDAHCSSNSVAQVNVSKVVYNTPIVTQLVSDACENDAVSFLVANVEPGMRNEVTIAGETFRFYSDTLFDLDYLTPGCYDVDLISVDVAANCATSPATFANVVCVYSNPISDFELAKAVTFEASDFVIQNNSLDAEMFAWAVNGTFADSAFHLSKDFGEYRENKIDVCLEAITEPLAGLMCRDTLCKSVVVVGGALVYFPTAFTPDGNNLNNVWQAQSDGFFDFFTYQIYNRWGEVIYTGNDVTDYWDGIYKGTLVQPGVYVFEARYRQINKVGEERITGSITLIR